MSDYVSYKLWMQLEVNTDAGDANISEPALVRVFEDLSEAREYCDSLEQVLEPLSCLEIYDDGQVDEVVNSFQTPADTE